MSNMGDTRSTDDTHVREKCPYHREQISTYLCVTCESNICSTCCFRNHKASFGCEVIELVNLAAEVHRRKEILSQDLKSLEELSANMKNILHEKKESITRDYKIARTRVSTEESEVHEKSQICHNELLVELNKKGTTEPTELDSGKQFIEDVLGVVDNEEPVKGQSEDEHLFYLSQVHRSIEKVAKAKQEITQFKHNMEEKSHGLIYKKIFNNATFGEVRGLLLVGSVMIDAVTLLHVFDERSRRGRGGVCLLSIDETDPEREIGRQLVTVSDQISPVVISHVTLRYQSDSFKNISPVLRSALDILYDITNHMLFSVGRNVFIVGPLKAVFMNESICPAKHLVIKEVPEGSFISSISAAFSSLKMEDRFLISVSESNQLIEYRVTGEPLRTIDTGNSVPAISCLAFSDKWIAIAGYGQKDVLLFTFSGDNSIKRVGSLSLPSDSLGLLPVCLLSTGSTWLVLYASNGNEKKWKVVDYEKNGDLLNIYDEGNSPNIRSVPISITRYGRNAYITFADRTLRKFSNANFVGID